MEEKELLSILDRDPVKGMELLKRQYRDILHYSLLQRLSSPDDIQDCIQETLTDFYLQRNKFDGTKGSLKGYLLTIAKRKAIRKYWKHQHQWMAARFAPLESDDIGDWEQREQLYQALSRLPELDRTLLEMKYYQGYNGREIARRLDMNYETVKKRLQRALKKLLQMMEG